MTNHVLLNNIDHKDLKVETTRAATFGDNVMFSVTYPLEFRDVQAHYPIFFKKDENTGQFESVAMFGFEQGENLFLNENGWDADYIPFSIERQPFLIGFENGTENTVIHIDMDDARVNAPEGEKVFLEHGGNTSYLERIAAILDALHQGHEGNAAFMKALTDNDLLESFNLDVELNDGSQNRLSGFYTINEEKLNTLNGASLADLNKRGYLQAIYMVVASLSNAKELIKRRNALL